MVDLTASDRVYSAVFVACHGFVFQTGVVDLTGLLVMEKARFESCHCRRFLKVGVKQERAGIEPRQSSWERDALVRCTRVLGEKIKHQHPFVSPSGWRLNPGEMMTL
jgi:hypothetical protein